MFNGLFFRTTWESRQQKGKRFWILLEREMMGWQWHQLDHMQIICTSIPDKQPRQYTTHSWNKQKKKNGGNRLTLSSIK